MLDGFHLRQKKNADFTWSQGFGANFTGSTFKMQIKDSAGNVEALLTTANGGIVATFGTPTILDFFLSYDDMPEVGSYTYDVLRLTDNGSDPDFVDSIMGGNFIIVAGTTDPV